ncbi:FtsX-like permease family protein [Candidatus Bathyarchaeota archaeon]|nr:FtsX-like permease family protein [Candidatus Bathyarchaeota archaeon]
MLSKGFLCLILVITLTTQLNTTTTAQPVTTITGTILAPDCSPYAGANIACRQHNGIGTPVKSDEYGRFTLTLESQHCNIIIYADEPVTPGYDYLPVEIYQRLATGNNLTVKLVEAGTVEFTGFVQYVDSEGFPTDYVYVLDVADPVPGISTLDTYSTDHARCFQLPGNEDHCIIVPLGSTNVLIESKTSSLGVDVYRGFPVTVEVQIPGERNVVDLTVPAINYNIQRVEAVLADVELFLDEMEAKGFYLAKEHGDLEAAEASLRDSMILINDGSSVEGYVGLKSSYLKIRQIQLNLQMFEADSVPSVYILLLFLAVSSASYGFFSSEKNYLQFTVGSLTYAVATLVLKTVYPGSNLVDTSTYWLSAAASLLLVYLVAFLAPIMLGRRRSSRGVGLGVLLAPVFSIAKRSLKRRQLRFILMFISVLVLTSGFVSLTSFSGEYGVSGKMIHRVASSGVGVLIRSSKWSVVNTLGLELSQTEVAWLGSLEEAEAVSYKYCSTANTNHVCTISSPYEPYFKAFKGVIAFNSSLEQQVMPLNETLVEGRLPVIGEVAFSSKAKHFLQVDVGETVTIRGKDYVVSGIFDDDTLEKLREYDYTDYLPEYLWRDANDYVLNVTVPAESTLFFDISEAQRFNLLLMRIAVKPKEDTDLNQLAERIALERGYHTWTGTQTGSTMYWQGTYYAGKGAALIIPYTIVMLNMITTILNALHERRNEITVLSSIGLNPSHIMGLYTAEAAVTGFMAGGLGYLVGITLYWVAPLLGFSFMVEQKVSGLWSLATVGIAVSSVVAGAYVALRSSVVVTPSLLSRWRILKPEGFLEPYVTVVPVKLSPESVDGFAGFMVKRLEAEKVNPLRVTSLVKLTAEGERRVIRFYHKALIFNEYFYTSNRLVVDLGAGWEFPVRLLSFGDSEWCVETGSLVRLFAMEWSNQQK